MDLKVYGYVNPARLDMVVLLLPDGWIVFVGGIPACQRLGGPLAWPPSNEALPPMRSSECGDAAPKETTTAATTLTKRRSI